MAKCIFSLKDPVTENSHDLGESCLASRVSSKNVLTALASRNPDWWANKMWQARTRKETLWAEIALPRVELTGGLISQV